MGLIRAAIDSFRHGMSDQWLEVIECEHMDAQTVLSPGVLLKRGDQRGNRRTEGVISQGSTIHIEEGQCMLLIDGGKVVDFSAEPGYYTVNLDSAPSAFTGGLHQAVKDTFSRFQYAGGTPVQQRVVYINLQEIRGLKFGTPNPLNYFDNFYNAELFLRSYGTYSIRVVDPIKFYLQVADRSLDRSIRMDEINEQYRNEFLNAFQSSLNQLSIDGIRISHLPSKGRELAKTMQDILDEEWKEQRGFIIESVGIASISYTEESQELLQMRNRGALLSDPTIREGYVQSTVAHGIEEAGRNAHGAQNGFMGINLGMNAAQSMQSFSQTNAAQMQQDRQSSQAGSAAPSPSDPAVTNSNATTDAPAAQPSANSPRFCPNCGSPVQPADRFCSNCGHKLK